MKNTDAVLYVDTDVIFLSPVENLWREFQLFSSEQVGGLAKRVGWNFKVPESNTNFIRIPGSGVTQVNSGVCVLMSTVGSRRT